MRYYRIERDDAVSLVVEEESTAYDLTETGPAPTSFLELASAASMTDSTVDAVARKLLSTAPEIERKTVRRNLTRPVDPDEVWGAGVTYAISQESREGEGGLAQSYVDAYEAERPEVYFKATPSRTVGPGEPVGIRGDSTWDVPEPELSIVLYDGDIVGYTIGNDVCSRDIERENLLYLPQSKTYSKCCAIGPCIATDEAIGDPLDVEMRMRISRDGETVFEGSASTSEMVRTCEELTGYLKRYNDVPEATVLLTGTSIIPPDDVTLMAEDVVDIEIENVGTLSNPVERL